MLILNAAEMQKRVKAFERRQKYIDATVLRLSEPYIPKISGTLIQSGIRGTKVGSGAVIYNAPYSRKIYYSKREIGRSNGALRGNEWFERMKRDKKEQILREVAKIDK